MVQETWSCKFFPTPGRAWIKSIPALDRVLGDPIPDLIKIEGDPIEPAHNRTSFFALISNFVLSLETLMPFAWLFSKDILSTSILVIIVKFFRCFTGLRKAAEAEFLIPFIIVD